MKLHLRVRKLMGIWVATVILIAAIPTEVFAVDYSNHWAELAINEWRDKGIINGYENGAFKPQESITRAEFAKILSQVFGLTYTDTAKEFIDVKANEWYKTYIDAITAAGFMFGTDENFFYPNRSITREEAIYALSQAYHITSADSADFIDEASISTWALEAVDALATNQYINGYPDGTFRPQGALTRAEAVTLLDKITAEIINKSGVYTEDIDGNLVVNTPNVVLENIEIEGNLYLAEGIGEGDVTLNNIKVKGKTIIEGGGSNSVKLQSTALKGVLIDKSKGKVRLYSDDFSSVGYLEINSPSNIEGSLGTVKVKTNQLVSFNNAKIEAMQVSGDGAQVELDKETVVQVLTTEAKVSVFGKGTIRKAQINASGVMFEKQPDKINVSDGIQQPSVPSNSSGNLTSGDDDTIENSSKNIINVYSVKVLDQNKIEIQMQAIGEVRAYIQDADFNGMYTTKWTIEGDKQTTIVTLPKDKYLNSNKNYNLVLHMTGYENYIVPIKWEAKPLIELVRIEGPYLVTTGSAIQFKENVIVTPDDETYKEVEWSLEGEIPNGTNIDQTGKLTTGSVPGKTTIVATAKKDITKFAKYEVTIKELEAENEPEIEVTGVTLNYNQLTLEKGDKNQLEASVIPINATNKNVYWESSNPEVVEINAVGQIVAKSAGNATITVSTFDGNYRDICNIQVNNSEITEDSFKFSGVVLNKGYSTDTLLWINFYPSGIGNPTTINSEDLIVQVGSKEYTGVNGNAKPVDGEFSANVYKVQSNPDAYTGIIKIVNNSGFIEGESVTVTGRDKLSGKGSIIIIRQVDNSELTTTIAEAEKNKSTVVVSVDGLDVLRGNKWVTQEVMNKYDKSISKAIEYIEQASATQEQVDKALDELKDAIVVFNDLKQDGKKEESERGYLVSLLNEYSDLATLRAFNVVDGQFGNEILSGQYADVSNRVAFDISDIKSGYRIKDFILNGRSYREGIITGKYGGLSTTLRNDCTASVQIEKIPSVLPSIQKIKMIALVDNKEEVPVISNVIPAQATDLVIEVDIENNEIAFQTKWEYSEDGKEWKEIFWWQNHHQVRDIRNCRTGNGNEIVDLSNKQIKVTVVGQKDYSQGSLVSQIYYIEA